jgi:hypothetical protein
MSKAAAKRELLALVASIPVWEEPSAVQQAEIDRLKAIAFPNGMSLPRI